MELGSPAAPAIKKKKKKSRHGFILLNNFYIQVISKYVLQKANKYGDLKDREVTYRKDIF